MCWIYAEKIKFIVQNIDDDEIDDDDNNDGNKPSMDSIHTQ